MERANREPDPLSIKIQYRDSWGEFWCDYISLDREFRRRVYNGNMGDLRIAREQLVLEELILGRMRH